MLHILSSSTWVSLSPEQRNRIRVLFNIPRSGSTEVRDGQIVTDGTTTMDFQHLTIEKMQAYLFDESTDFHKLFDKIVARVQDEIDGKSIVVSIPPANVDQAPTADIPNKRGRPAKKNV